MLVSKRTIKNKLNVSRWCIISNEEGTTSTMKGQMRFSHVPLCCTELDVKERRNFPVQRNIAEIIVKQLGAKSETFSKEAHRD